MIQSGLYNQLINNAGIQALLPSPAKNFVHFVRAPKQPGSRFIVLHLVNVPPAEATLDGSSGLINGEIQLDHYAEDGLAARQLCEASKALFQDFAGTLSDGTTIQFYETPFDFDDAYELGGVGYLFRAVLRLRCFYDEAGQSNPQPPISDMAQPFHWVAQAGDNSQQIKAGQGFVLGGYAFSAQTTAYPVYIKLFDTAAAPDPAGGDKPRLAWGVEAGDEAAPNIPRGGIQFNNGIWMLIVKGIQDDDDTGVLANDATVDVYWQ